MNDPQAVLLYSLTADHCDVDGVLSYFSLLTMMSSGDSATLLKALESEPRSGTIVDSTVAGNSGSSTNSTGGSGGTTSNAQSAPTTAVAMSILYSITGIITVLFLVIIATGAWRAHRHPERYGPRRGFPGRARQSRAKGLARAMLETLPIVKFGDDEPAKPESRDIQGQDIELQEGSTSVQGTPERAKDSDASRSENEHEEQISSSPEAVNESGIGPDTKARSITSQEKESEANESGLGCSICTEDFTKGEDVRVLPCKHKYHPACIDPWLLNVSGTCPLW